MRTDVVTQGNGQVPGGTGLSDRPDQSGQPGQTGQPGQSDKSDQSDQADCPSRRPPGPSARPAAVVLGIIFVLFVVGAVAAGLTGSGPRRAEPVASTARVPGTGGLVAVPAAAVLAPVRLPGEPPADVVAALVVPRGTLTVPGSAVQHGVGLFDGTLRLQVPAAEGPAISFFHTELVAGRWHLLRVGPASGGYQLLAQHPGSDGYEWELGITLSPTRFRSDVPGVAAPPGGVTPASLRLFAVSDQS